RVDRGGGACGDLDSVTGSVGERAGVRVRGAASTGYRGSPGGNDPTELVRCAVRDVVSVKIVNIPIVLCLPNVARPLGLRIGYGTRARRSDSSPPPTTYRRPDQIPDRVP